MVNHAGGNGLRWVRATAASAELKRLEQRLFRLLARSVVGVLGDADPRARLVVSISHGVAPVTCTCPTERIDCTTSKLRREQLFNRVLEADGTIAGRTRESRSTLT